MQSSVYRWRNLCLVVCVYVQILNLILFSLGWWDLFRIGGMGGCWLRVGVGTML